MPNAVDPLWKTNDGTAGVLLRWANEHPVLRVMAGLHFLKVPAHLNRWAWFHTPYLNKAHFQFKAMLDSPDPIIRSHAKSIHATSVASFPLNNRLEPPFAGNTATEPCIQHLPQSTMGSSGFGSHDPHGVY